MKLRRWHVSNGNDVMCHCRRHRKVRISTCTSYSKLEPPRRSLLHFACLTRKEPSLSFSNVAIHVLVLVRLWQFQPKRSYRPHTPVRSFPRRRYAIRPDSFWTPIEHSIRQQSNQRAFIFVLRRR